MFCIAHGGGKRCQDPGCTKSARGSTGLCLMHSNRHKREGGKHAETVSEEFLQVEGIPPGILVMTPDCPGQQTIL